MENSYDAIVIGGGPAGSTVATRLAQRGHSVVLFEKERFPRFHIGESLLPDSMPLFEALGVADALKAADFLPKYAAEFVTADGQLTRRYAFSDGLLPSSGSAYEVDRSEFDRVLLENAAQRGVEVQQGTHVQSFGEDRDGVSVTCRRGAETWSCRARMLLDASGQNSFIAGRLKLREMDRNLKNAAIFSHFEGAKRHSGLEEGDITIVLVPGGWWWVIPLRGDRTSVGLVARAESLRGRTADETFLDEQIARAPYLRQRLAGARRVEPVRSASDYSYAVSKLASDRWILVGDAAAFIDPVFSTGIYLGMSSAFRAADVVDRALRENVFRRAAFQEYERWVKRNVGLYRRFVRGFYTPEFAELLMAPSDWLELRRAVTSLLAGGGVGHPNITWRIAVFRTLAKINRHLVLAPRIPARREVGISN